MSTSRKKAEPGAIVPAEGTLLSRATRRPATFRVIGVDGSPELAVLLVEDYGHPVRFFSGTREELADMLAKLQAALLRKP